jgi:uncharacterized protein YndB with AHSA1/START domain
MNAAVDDTTLEITRLFDALPARVFDAWLNREEWQSWIGPEGINCEVPLLEPRIGGRYRIAMRLSDGREVPVAGIFKIIDAPRTLAFTWGWENDPTRQSLITLTFREKAGKTETITPGDGTAHSTSSSLIWRLMGVDLKCQHRAETAPGIRDAAAELHLGRLRRVVRRGSPSRVGSHGRHVRQL